MKKLLFAFALGFLLLPLAQTKAQDVSVDFFYNNINGGSWIEIGNYGYCWQPDVAVSDSSWRPYADGYWAYTDLGWTWVSYEDFGWATYHYGRWVRLSDMGWVWVPGYRWGPAWVSWRYGGNYVGWAPLPPETEVVYESRPLTGHLDVEFDIGPASYNFVDVRYLGEPVLRSRLVPSEQNVTYVTQTVNVTNITYKNKTVYNYGPDLTTVNQYSSRPIQKLKLERQTNLDAATAVKSGDLTKVQGNALIVAAPPEIKKSSATPPPPKVKTKVEQPKIEKGWSVVGDENAKAQLKEKLKAEDPKKIPPPASSGNAAGASASVSPGVSASSTIAGSPSEKGKGKNKGKGKQADQLQAGASASASPRVGAMTSPAASPEFGKKGKGKGKNKGADQFQSGAAASPMASPGAPGAENAATAAPEGGKRGKGKGRERFGATGPTAAPTIPAEEQGKRKDFERQNAGPSPGGQTTSPENFNEPRGKHKQSEQPPAGASPGGPQGGAGAQTGPYGEERGKRHAEGVNTPPAGGTGQGPAGSPQGGGEKKHEGKGKDKGQTPSPSPQ